MLRHIFWLRGKLYLLDQRSLPLKKQYLSCQNHKQVARAIREMAVRGAPLLGVVAAYGLVLASQEQIFRTEKDFIRHLERAKAVLLATRPTAVNLRWALERMERLWTDLIREKKSTIDLKIKTLEKEAGKIFHEDRALNRRIGNYGAGLLKKGSRVLTHCNAGSLATAGYGTALGVIRTGWGRGKVRMVFADETRPYLQGSRLTAWELKEEGIPCTVITDNMAGFLMQRKMVDLVIVGADRIAANGDVANKIGTYSLAVLAGVHHLPFYVAAPYSTIDLKLKTGQDIPIEERDAEEVLSFQGKRVAPDGVGAWHPAFDITPSRFVSAIITDRGVITPPYPENLRLIFK